MENWIKAVIGIIATFVVVSIAGLFIFSRVFNQTLPVYKGEKDFKGVNNEIKIYRDNNAVPYIFADGEEDASFALGYVHAQERMFQMDLFRRAGLGRLSEIFGSRTISFDLMFRTIGVDSLVKVALVNLKPEVRKILDSYSAGVNAYITEAEGKYPVEFDVLGYDPEPWKPEHSLIIGKILAWELNIGWWTDIVFADLIQKLGEEKVKEIIPDYPENAPFIIPKNISSMPKIDKAIVEIDRDFRKFMGISGNHIGSNNWAVNGARSISGKPIIANDPHLGLTIPAKWFIAVIKSKNWNAAGFTIPGAPAIIIGKNNSIAWSVTNVMTDDTDLYSERIDSSGKNYFFNDQWLPLKRKEFTIAVKDSESVSYIAKFTHRGPIISDIHPFNKMYGGKHIENRARLSLRWVGSEFHDEFNSLYLLNKAENWEQFKTALSGFSTPGQNFVYADSSGNIGYICAAKIPVRNLNSPTMIFDGTNPQSDWSGFVPYEQMPVIFNPIQNFIATANNKVKSDFQYHISNLWEPSSRIERITQLLNSKNKHSARDFGQYQNDFVSPYAKEITQFLLDAFKGAKIKDKNLQTTISLFENWNYELIEYSQVPSIYAIFFQFLLQNTFEDEMGEKIFAEYKFMANIPYRTILKMLNENNSIWFDDIKTKTVENRDFIIRKSLVDALDFLERNFGKDAKDWQWSKLHRLTIKHQFHGINSLVDKFIDIGPYSVGGDGTTIFNTEYSFNDPYDVVLGPSMRFIYDFANPNEFRAILPTGQSGNVLSDNYKDMTEDWLLGKYLRIKTDENFIRNSDYKVTILK